MNKVQAEIKRIIKAFGYSFQGIKATYKSEAAFRIEIVFFIIFLPLGLYLGETNIEKAVLVGSLFIVLLAEVVNSAIEAVVDRISTEQHPLAGRAKDMGSAAVLISLVMVLTVWGIILFL